MSGDTPTGRKLLAESTVLAAVVEALEDPARPEESPVDAARRLRAEVERLAAERDFIAVCSGVSAARLTECQGLLASERDASANIAAGLEQVSAQLDRLTRERDAWIFAARTGRCRELFDLDLAPDAGEINAWGESVRERAAFDAVREDSTTDEPACSRCKDTGVTRSVSVDMSGHINPPTRCPYCTAEPGGDQ